jgi:uncharacterized membrane protein YedE/YeeE
MTFETAALDQTAGPAPALPRPNLRVVAAAGLLLAGGALAIGGAFAWRQAALYLLGGALGLVLYHAAFGFASSWRRFVAEGRGAGLRAQMVMLALATAIFLPVLAEGSLFGRPVGGAVAPFGVSVAVGAFLFGVGMQLGGACASGTLYTVGGGSTRMLVTLVFFMVGSVIGSAHIPWWLELPKQSISLARELGLLGALGLQLGLFALIAGVSVVIERRRHGRLEEGAAGGPAGWRRFVQGPWPMVWGAVLLALLNVATLGLAGHPWTISFGYTLWGAKAAAALGLDVASWEFWTWRFPKQALEGSVFATSTSLMNFGIIAGAFLAAGLAGRFAPARALALKPALAAAIGGTLMGYGARLAFGCNVGAYFSGVASGSLHGWLWFLAALAGTYLGTRLRPAFGLDATRSEKTVEVK